MSGVNKVILIGNVGQDPEIRTGTVKVASLSLATSETWKDKNGEKKEKTSWHQLTFFNKLADIVEQYVSKGNSIYIEGKLDYQEYEKDGIKKRVTKVVVNSLTMLGGTNTEGNSAPKKTATPNDEQDNLPF